MLNAGMTKQEVLTEIISQVQDDLNKLNEDLLSYDGEDAVEKAKLEGIVDGYQQALSKLCTFTSLI